MSELTTYSNITHSKSGINIRILKTLSINFKIFVYFCVYLVTIIIVLSIRINDDVDIITNIS